MNGKSVFEVGDLVSFVHDTGFVNQSKIKEILDEGAIYRLEGWDLPYTFKELALISKGDPISLANHKVNMADKAWVDAYGELLKARKRLQKAHKELINLIDPESQ